MPKIIHLKKTIKFLIISTTILTSFCFPAKPNQEKKRTGYFLFQHRNRPEEIVENTALRIQIIELQTQLARRNREIQALRLQQALE